MASRNWQWCTQSEYEHIQEMNRQEEIEGDLFLESHEQDRSSFIDKWAIKFGLDSSTMSRALAQWVSAFEATGSLPESSFSTPEKLEMALEMMGEARG